MEPCKKEWELATLQANYKSMMNILEEIRDDLKSFKTSCDTHYATKWDYENNNKRLTRLENILDKILFISVSSAITVIWVWWFILVKMF